MTDEIEPRALSLTPFFSCLDTPAYAVASKLMRIWDVIILDQWLWKFVYMGYNTLLRRSDGTKLAGGDHADKNDRMEE